MLKTWHIGSMRKSFAIAAIAAVSVVYSVNVLAALKLWGADNQAMSPVVQSLLQANIAFDKAVYGPDSLFQAREETALGFTKLTQNQPQEALTLFQHAAWIRRTHAAADGDEQLRAIYNVILANRILRKDADNKALAEQALTIALEEHEPSCEQVSKALQQCVMAYRAVNEQAQAEHYAMLLGQWQTLEEGKAAIRDQPKPEPPQIEAQTIAQALHIQPPNENFQLASSTKPSTVAPAAVPPPKGSLAVTWVSFEPDSRTDLADMIRRSLTATSQNAALTPVERGKALVRLAEIHTGENQPDEVNELAHQALKLFEPVHYQGPEYVCARLLTYAADIDEEDQEKKEEKQISTLKELEKLPICQSDPITRASVEEALSCADNESGLKHMQEALKLRESALGKDNFVVAKTLNKVADLCESAEQTEALKDRARRIGQQQYVRDFRRYGPLSTQVMEDREECEALDVDGISSDNTMDLVTLQHLYGKASPATAGVAASEARNISDSDAPEIPRSSKPIALGVPLLVFGLFGSLFLFITKYEGKRAAKYGAKWKVGSAMFGVATGFLLGAGIWLESQQPTPAQWLDKKQYELLSQSVKAFEAGNVKNTAYAGACYELSCHIPAGPGKEAQEEKLLRKSIAVYKQGRLADSSDRTNLKSAYERLADLLDNQNKTEEAKKLREENNKVASPQERSYE